MAIASVGTMGTTGHSTSASSFTHTTATNALASGDFAILVVSFDNTSTVDGNNNENTSVSGGTGTWTKLGEYGNTNGAAAAGVVNSAWLFVATGTVSVGTVITISFASNRTDKACSMWKFTKAAGQSIRLDPDAATNPITSAVDASNGFGSSAFSGLPSQSRLYFRSLAKEANTTTALTPSANFTAITGTRSRNNASAVVVGGEFRINTSTGETSNPTLAVSGDTAGLFFAIEEYLPGIIGSIAASESGGDTASVAGDVLVIGSLAATETGADTAVIAGDVLINGALAVTEAGDDTAALVGGSVVIGALAVAEVGADVAALAGQVFSGLVGSIAASEIGLDLAAFASAWALQSVATETWNGQATNPESWSAQGSSSETWAPQAESAETWAPQSTAGETWA